jgi:adenylate cyclase
VREVEDGGSLLSRAINLDPNLAFARLWSGWAQIYLGDEGAAMEQFHVALRLSPLDPRIFLSQTGVAYAHFLAGRYEDASSWATTAIRQQSNFLVAHRILMASHAMAGRITEAREVCAGALLIDPSQRIAKTKNRKFVEALRIAGMPE